MELTREMKSMMVSISQSIYWSRNATHNGPDNKGRMPPALTGAHKRQC